jgi:hypothetical protein
MRSFGELYYKFINPAQEETPSIRYYLENIKELKITTSYPLLLRLFDARQAKHLSDADLVKCLELIESFVVRRAVCGVTNKSLNKLFLQRAKAFPHTDHFQSLHKSLSEGSGNSRFPKDNEFATAFMTQSQYGRDSTHFILCRFEKNFKHKETVDLSTTTIEHILPQTLTQEWKDALSPEAEKVHPTLVNRFGNLTLTSYNSELSNRPFVEKKSRLQNTHIELNRWITQQSSWGAAEIEERAKNLLEIAKTIWMAPLDTI